MPEASSKPCQLSKMMRHIEGLGIVRTVYSHIFRHIQGHSAIFINAQGHLRASSHIEASSGIIEAY